MIHLKRFFYLIVQLMAVVTLTACHDSVSAKNDCLDSAQQFWKGFRAAVVRQDVNAVMEMTHFPFLMINSINDDSDRQQIERGQFKNEWPRLLNINPGEGPGLSSMKQLVVTNQILQSKQCAESGQQFTVGLWFFYLQADGWKFTRAYTEEN